jgi:crotonobetainyl-CoA:carnitine CoA-transferase CaiB-like acyl-CoA transferase
VKPLEDIRIIAIEQYGAGPFGSVHLADLGADVIKIEEPASGGDIGRYVPPYQQGEDSLFFEAFNRNKRSLSLDLATADGRAVFDDLVRVSDVVYSNLRGDVPAKIGITYDALKAPQRAHRVLRAHRLRDDRPAGERARLRLHSPGDRRLDGHHR